MSLYSLCADLGRDLVGFIRKSKWHALAIGLLALIAPLNLIFIVLLICYLYRGK